MSSRGNSEKIELGKNLRFLIIIHVLYMLGNGFSSIFLNIFIWKYSSSIQKVVEYNLYSTIAGLISFAVAGWISKTKGLKINLILGLFLSSVFYLIVFLFKSSLISYIPLVGTLVGISIGFYYLGFNVLGYDFSTDNNRAYYFGLLNLANSIPSMAAPLISGYIISLFNGNIGYGIVFGISFVLYFCGFIFSIFVSEYLVKSKYCLKSMFALSLKDSNLKRVMASEIIYWSRDAVLPLIINILIFIAVKKEQIVGNYSFVIFLIATVSSYIGGRLIKPKNRTKILFAGVIFISLISSIFFFGLNLNTLYIFGIINAAASVMAAISHSSISYASISNIPNYEDLRTELIVIMELFLGIGKVPSLIVFAVISSNYQLLSYFLFAIGALQVLRWVFLRKVDIVKC